ncbi:MAG TPA: NFACT RNA binding domain-containing protein [Polyangiaceae bacterium]|jgi:predicted ribosome quality control (RQC) complex YloA/Tae2 family protein
MSPVEREAELEALRQDTTRDLEKRRKRLIRRCEAIRGDLQKAEQARELARVAALAAPTVATIRRGTTSMTVDDWSTGELVRRTIPLDPARAPRDSLERIFATARRLRNGAPVATARLTEAERDIADLDRRLAMVAAATNAEELATARGEAKLPKRSASKPAQERKPPYRTFRTPRGTILVGRGAARNDELTFHVAKPYHLWLHARGFPGAHVVVQLRRDQSCAPDLLVDAAHLAAHFSDARGERTVEVTYVQRKFVKKTKGSAPGAVAVEREKVLPLRFDDARLARLLASEIDQNA